MALYHRFIDNKARQTLVALHGFMGQGDDWEFLVHHMRFPLNFLLIDLPGHGASRIGANESLSPDHFLHQMNILIDHLGLSEIHLLGYSLGGRLALQWALRYPERLQSLILESTNPGIADTEARRKRLKADEKLSAKLLSQDFERFLTDWYRQPIFGNLQNHPNFKTLLQRRLQNDVRQLSRALKAFSVGRQPSLWTQVGHFSHPVLVICGALDEKYRRITHTLQEQNPHLQIRVAVNSGHTVHFENPEWFAQTVQFFLESIK